MSRKSSVPRPTDAELEILEVLWESGPSTVRDVHAQLVKRRPTGYTTVLKLMQIMADKGLVKRNEKQRAHIYRARQPRETTQRVLLDHIVDRAFGGSAAQLAMRALSSRKTKPEELAEIRKMLDEYEGGKS
ncbi:MAG: BlaI/MecI/CopY family transcriptional regulator [bacterium]|nr:BlaI/MecI/CopY family transcriptional regulator [bacterium]